jgi:hypothetical protein
MAKTIGINLKLPQDLSIEIDRVLLDFKQSGEAMTKVKFVNKLIQIGLNHEKREYAKIKNQ